MEKLVENYPQGDDSCRKSLMANSVVNRSDIADHLYEGKRMDDSEKATFGHKSIVSEHGGESV